MCILVYVFFSLFPPPAVEAVVSGWAVLMMVWKQEVTARPKETHLQPEIEIPSSPPQIPHPHLSSLFQKQKTKQTNTAIVILPSLPQEANVYLTRGDRINLCTSTLTHNLTLRPASLSVQEKCVFVFFCFFFSFFVFFSLFWGSLLLLLGKGKGLFHCVCLYFFNMGTEIGGEVW